MIIRKAYMTTENIIRSSLIFLEEEYHFKFEIIKDQGTHYVFKNKYGRFEYYEWKQFQESSFCIYANDECKTIDMLQENPKIIGKYWQQNKGLKGFFCDNRREYWIIIANILKKEIKNTSFLFGLKVF